MDAFEMVLRSPGRPTLVTVTSLLLPALPPDCGHRSPLAPTLLSPRHPVCDSLQEVSCEGQGFICQAEVLGCGTLVRTSGLTILCFCSECIRCKELSVGERGLGLSGLFLSQLRIQTCGKSLCPGRRDMKMRGSVQNQAGLSLILSTCDCPLLPGWWGEMFTAGAHFLSVPTSQPCTRFEQASTVES